MLSKTEDFPELCRYGIKEPIYVKPSKKQFKIRFWLIFIELKTNPRSIDYAKFSEKLLKSID